MWKQFLLKYFSRKFIAYQEIMIAVVLLPVFFKEHGVSDNITMLSLGIVAMAGGAYNIVNFKDAKLDKIPEVLMDKAKELIETKTDDKKQEGAA